MAKKESKNTSVKVVEKSSELEIQQEKNPVLSMLQLAMTDSNVDLEKMEKIMEMVERYEDKLAVKAYNRDMAIMQGEIPKIEFNAVINDKYGKLRSKYTTYEGIMEVVQPILSKHGFSVSFNPKAENKELNVDCMISHREGHIERSNLSLPFDDSGNKNAVQSIGSSMSYAKRYALCLKLNIATGGEDNDGNDIVDEPRSLAVLTAMTKKANNKKELVILWDGCTPKEQEIISKVIAERKIELGIVNKS